MIRELPFSIPVSGVIRISENLITIIVNKAETIISLETGIEPGKRLSLEGGKTTYDVILESAREIIRRKGFNRFTGPELFEIALENHPGLKKASFISRVVASTPNHPSYKHHKSGRDFLSRIGPGLYWLNEKYTSERDETKVPTIFDPQ